MSEYILIVGIPDTESGNTVRYSATLTGLHESYPEDYFRVKKNRLHLHKSLQQQLSRPISNTDIDTIITKWLPDIKSGLHQTTVTLSLSPVSEPPLEYDFPKENLLTESDCQTIPETPQHPRPAPKHPKLAPAPSSVDFSANNIPHRITPARETHSSPNLPPPEGATIPLTANHSSQTEPITLWQQESTSPSSESLLPGTSLVKLTSNSQGFDSIVGLEQIKVWIRGIQPWFEQNQGANLRPCSLLLEGLPGCGKKMIASAIAQELKLPQFKLELSWLTSQSERSAHKKLSDLLKTITNTSPNILLVDGLEQFQVSTSSIDDTADNPYLETFLRWLKRHESPVFSIVITQDRDMLPPKLIRANPFDASFIVLPPNLKERSELLHKQVQKYQLPPISPHILSFVIAETDGYSGGELNQLVQEAIYLVGVGHLPTETHWQQALESVNPQFRRDDKQQILKKYMRLLEQGHSESTSQTGTNLLERLIL